MESTHKTLLTRAIVGMLRPLIHLLIRHEVTHTELNDLIRQTYVEIAYDKFSIPELEMTVSRIAVLTGLSRKEVGRMRDTLKDSDAILKQKPNRAQRVVHGWLNDKEFLDMYRNPLDLPLKNKKAGKEHASFISLVKRYSGDITFGAVLEELNHIGVTDQPDEHTVRLVNSAYVPHKHELEKVRIIATSVTDMFTTAMHNIEAKKKDARLQRQVIYSDVNAELAEAFQKLSEEKALLLMEELNQHLAGSQKESAKNPSKDQKRVGFGMYYIEEPSVKQTTEPEE